MQTDVTPEPITTNEAFVNWQSERADVIAAAAATANKDPQERTLDEQEAYDALVAEIRQVIPGANQLSAEQVRGLVNNMDLSTTRHANQQIRSLDDASRYTSEERVTEQQGVHIPEGQAMQLRPSDTPNLVARERDKGSIDL